MKHGLQEIIRKKPNAKNQVEAVVEEAVVAIATEYPAYEQGRVSNELKKRGVLVSPGGVRSIWLRHQLFLFPLVTGAASQLVPIWAKPGMQTPWHAQARQRLGAGGSARALLFLAGGILLAAGWRGGLLFSVAALAAFLLQLASLVHLGTRAAQAPHE